LSNAAERAKRRDRAHAARKSAVVQAEQPVVSSRPRRIRSEDIEDAVEAAVVQTEPARPKRKRAALAVLDDVETIVPEANDVNPGDEDDDDEPDFSGADLSKRRKQRQKSTGSVGGSSRALALPQEDLTRQLDPGDTIMPKIRISQAMSQVNKQFSESRGKEGIAMGSWYHTTSGTDLGDTIYFIPCDMRKSRSLFKQGQGLICRSFDMLQGEGNPGILCEGTYEERHEYPAEDRGCSLRLWTRDGETNTPPPCGITFNYPGYVIVDADEDEPKKVLQGLLQLRGSGTGAAKVINSAVMQYGGGRDWHNLIIELSVISRKNNKGEFYVPTAEYFGSTEEPEFAKIRKQVLSFAQASRGMDLRATIENDPDE
jgi:hypothetical protein